jgi:hypothetical protein
MRDGTRIGRYDLEEFADRNATARQGDPGS